MRGSCGVFASLVGLAVVTAGGQAWAQVQFEAVDGYVVMEAESVPGVMGWETETPGDAMAEKARGDVRYFNSEEASICSTNKNKAEGFPTMDYRFRVSEGGVYWVKMNMRKQVHCVSEGNDGNKCHSGAGCQSMGIQSNGDTCDGANQCWRSDISNDAYVSMETADGQGVPYVGGNTEIMKFFGGKANEYGWSGNGALDHNAPTYDLQPGDYVFKVRGRSRGLKIDRIIIFHEDADENTAKSAPETVYIDPGTGGGSATGSGGSATGPSSGSGGATPGSGSGGTQSPGPSANNNNNTEADGGCALGDGAPGPGDGRAASLAVLLGLAALRRRRR